MTIPVPHRLDPHRHPSSLHGAMTEDKMKKWAGLSRLVLGSKSWSRRTLLQELNVPEFEIQVADIDERAISAPTPQELVLQIGIAKARALSDRVKVSDDDGTTLLVCGDSVVTHGGSVLGKPRDVSHARSILRSYATAPATTVSSIVVLDIRRGVYWAGVGEAEVYFRAMPDEVIEEMIETGGAMESAGALRIEHPKVKMYTECIIGERSAVMGFPLSLAERLLQQALRGGDDGTSIEA